MSCKVLVVNGFSDDNKGDCAIGLGMIAAIQRQLGACEFQVMSMNRGSRKELSAHYRFTAEAANVVALSSVYGATYRTAERGGATRVAELAAETFLSWMLLLLAFVAGSRGRFLLRGDRREAYAAFWNCDAVVSKGGEFLFHRRRSGFFREAVALLALYNRLYPLMMAKAARRPAMIYAQSVGPFEGSAARRLARIGLGSVDVIALREGLSREVVADLQIPSRLLVVPDAAFADFGGALLSESDEVDRLPERFIGVTVRQWDFSPQSGAANAAAYEQYLDTMAATLDRIVDEFGLDVVFVPQVIGPALAGDDRLASQAVWERMLRKKSGHVLRGDYSPRQLIGIYARMEVLVGTRFHSVIFASTVGVPAVAIAYSAGYKTQGIMAGLGLSEFVLSITDLSADALVQRVRQLIAARQQYSDHLKERCHTLIAESEGVARHLSDLLLPRKDAV